MLSSHPTAPFPPPNPPNHSSPSPNSSSFSPSAWWLATLRVAAPPAPSSQRPSSPPPRSSGRSAAHPPRTSGASGGSKSLRKHRNQEWNQEKTFKRPRIWTPQKSSMAGKYISYLTKSNAYRTHPYILFFGEPFFSLAKSKPLIGKSPFFHNIVFPNLASLLPRKMPKAKLGFAFQKPRRKYKNIQQSSFFEYYDGQKKHIKKTLEARKEYNKIPKKLTNPFSASLVISFAIFTSKWLSASSRRSST